MKKKFTEEQYKKIIIAYDELLLQEDVDFGLLDGGSNASKNLYELLEEDTCDFLAITNSYEATIAIANPLTREWAHDKFVEKEKKYRWISKKHLPNGKFRVLAKSHDGYVMDVFYSSSKPCVPLTEAEVREACYNPDMFDREEVE